MKRLVPLLWLLPLLFPCVSLAGAERVYPESAFLHAERGGHLIDVTKAPFFAKGDGLHDDTDALKMALRFAKEFTRVANEPGGAVGGSPRRDTNWTGRAGCVIGSRRTFRRSTARTDSQSTFELMTDIVRRTVACCFCR